MDGILDVQVAGVPSKKYGEQVGAFIILKDDVEMDQQDVIDYCRGQFPAIRSPSTLPSLTLIP